MSRLPHRRSVFRHNHEESQHAPHSPTDLRDASGSDNLGFYHRYFTKSVPVPAQHSVVTYHPDPPSPPSSSSFPGEKDVEMQVERDEKKNDAAAAPRVSVYVVDFVRRFSFFSIGSLILLVTLLMLLLSILVIGLAVHFTHQSALLKAAKGGSSAAAATSLLASTSYGVAGFLPTTSASSPYATVEGSSSTLHTSALATETSTLHTTAVATAVSSAKLLTSSFSTSVAASTAAAAAASSSSSPSSMGAAPSASANPNAYAYTSAPLQLAVLGNFPDPTIYYDAAGSTWYALGTNTAAGILSATTDVGNALNSANVQIATSSDFENWTLLPPTSNPLPNLGNWTLKGTMPPSYSVPNGLKVNSANVWAPEVIQHPTTGEWLMYYSAASWEAPVHCIGAATASAPTGPFQPIDTALACPIAAGGAIDASAFVEPTNNTVYIAYKIDGNSKGHGGECGNTVAPIASTPLMLQAMSADGVTPDPSHPPFQILDRVDDDGPLIEAPALVKVAGVYYLFYSSGCTRSPDYNIKYATASNLYGPYTRAAKPLLSTGDYGLQAPGSVTVRYAGATTVGEAASSSTTGWKMALHARVTTAAGGIRPFFTTGLSFDAKARTVAVVAV